MAVKCGSPYLLLHQPAVVDRGAGHAEWTAIGESDPMTIRTRRECDRKAALRRMRMGSMRSNAGGNVGQLHRG